MISSRRHPRVGCGVRSEKRSASTDEGLIDLMMRAYRLPTTANPGKLAAVAAILPEWQRGLVHVQYLQVRKLKAGIGTLGWLEPEETRALPSYLSQRQWKSVVNQVNMALQAWQAAARVGIRGMIAVLVLPPEQEALRADLYRVNAYSAWWLGDGLLDEKRGLRVSDQAVAIAETLANAWVRAHRFPNLSRVRTMHMDGIIAGVSGSAKAHADYWVKVSTLVKGKPVAIPLHGYRYFAHAEGDIRNFCQVAVGEDGQVTFTLVKKSVAAPRRKSGRSVGLDWGLKNVFATSDGQILGRQVHAWLSERDTELAALVEALQRQGVRPRDSKRYAKLNRRIREYVRNEVNRILNRLAAKDIRELVVERLDFRLGGLSARLNRMLTRAGRAAVKDKLAALGETHGITVIEVNPAHTSRTCSGCGYADKRNRTSQKRFVCRFCGRKLLADINAARNILGRSGDMSGDRYLSKEAVLAEIDRRFHVRWRTEAADLRERFRRGTAVPLRRSGRRQPGSWHRKMAPDTAKSL
ncbi:transposase [Nocardia sp. CDC153]|uniref:RNA-guided endonuclease InsQ/TnpB family protein n=1 Tax=Nocardia sp. CDC153 TaxID=3112167 RepID=UPI002DC01D39|nr:transposase [Nocardia sp. CDC153]MEC3956153.1 transposase [Nocardia sp. CDC153]